MTIEPIGFIMAATAPELMPVMASIMPRFWVNQLLMRSGVVRLNRKGLAMPCRAAAYQCHWRVNEPKSACTSAIKTEESVSVTRRSYLSSTLAAVGIAITQARP